METTAQLEEISTEARKKRQAAAILGAGGFLVSLITTGFSLYKTQKLENKMEEMR